MRLHLSHCLHHVCGDVFQPVWSAKLGGVGERQIEAKKRLIGTKLLSQPSESRTAAHPEQRQMRTSWLHRHDGPCSQACVRLAQQFRHQLNGRSLENKCQRQSLPEVCLDASQKPCRQQRMAAKFKKVLRDV